MVSKPWIRGDCRGLRLQPTTEVFDRHQFVGRRTRQFLPDSAFERGVRLGQIASESSAVVDQRGTAADGDRVDRAEVDGMGSGHDSFVDPAGQTGQ